MRTISIKDIADNINLSRNTVSKVLNGKDGVLPETEDLIIKKAFEMGYKKINSELLTKAGIRQNVNYEQKRGDIAIVCHEVFSEFWARIINGISSVLSKTEYNLLYVKIHETDDNDDYELPANLKNGSVSGIIVTNIYDVELLNIIAKIPVPKIYLDAPVDSDTESLDGDIILIEGVKSISKITTEFIKQGKKKIGFIGDISYSKTIYDRWLGFKTALRENNIEIDKSLCFLSDEKSHFYAYQSITKTLKSLEFMPEAFVCANDKIAYTLMHYLKTRGYEIPNKVAISGYDNNPEYVLMEPQLTSVKVENEILGKRLARQLLLKINEPSGVHETIITSTQVVLR